MSGANQSMDLECCDRASTPLASAATVHEAAVSSYPNILAVDIHPRLPLQAHAGGVPADAAEAVPEVETETSAEVGAEVEVGPVVGALAEVRAREDK